MSHNMFSTVNFGIDPSELGLSSFGGSVGFPEGYGATKAPLHVVESIWLRKSVQLTINSSVLRTSTVALAPGIILKLTSEADKDYDKEYYLRSSV